MKRSVNFSGPRKYLATYMAQHQHQHPRRVHTLTCAKCHQRFELRAEHKTAVAQVAWEAGWREGGGGLYCPECAKEATK